jgi:hypothetical protein
LLCAPTLSLQHHTESLPVGPVGQPDPLVRHPGQRPRLTGGELLVGKAPGGTVGTVGFATE